MIADKVLIFYHYGPGINGGGPMGFVNKNIEGVKSSFFVTPNLLPVRRRPQSEKILSGVRSKISSDWDIAKNLKNAEITEDLFWTPMLKTAIRRYKEINAGNYKYIYFHDIYTLRACLPLLAPEQVVIFQPHSPEQISKETIYVSDNEKDHEWAKDSEKKVFERADIIVLPNKHVLPIYDNLISKKTQVEYLLSGCEEQVSLKVYPLESSKINIMYIGRRLQIKGFDLLLAAFGKVRQKRKDINLLLLGGGEKVDQEGVYDLGFSNTPHNWINSVDYVVNCNLQSYFDLSVMETLAIGTPIIMTSNFGHKTFVEHTSEGIINIGPASAENIEKAIFNHAQLKRNDNTVAINRNKEIYTKYYSKSKYVERLEEFCKSLLYKD